MARVQPKRLIAAGLMLNRELPREVLLQMPLMELPLLQLPASLGGALDRESRRARAKTLDMLVRLRAHARLVGRWRGFLMRLFEEVHYRPQHAGAKRAREEWEAVCAEERRGAPRCSITYAL